MTAPEATDPTPGEARLSDDVRQRIVIALCKADGISNSLGVTDAIVGIEDLRALLTAEVSLAARLAARDAEIERLRRERDAAEHLLRQSMDRASAAEAEVADLRARIEAEWFNGNIAEDVRDRILRAALGGEHA